MWMGAACSERPAEDENAAVLCSGADAFRVTAVWSLWSAGGGCEMWCGGCSDGGGTPVGGGNGMPPPPPVGSEVGRCW